MSPPTVHPPRLREALSYAARGWHVLPLHWPERGECSCGNTACPSPGKHPLTTHGLKDATTDPNTITGWWHQWPIANIGIATGSESNLIVLDVDPDDGGDESLYKLEQTYGPLPDTIESLTGGGGRHILFPTPAVPVRNSAGRLGPGLDVRAEGGYIVAPPSSHLSGDSYVWEVDHHPDDVPLADMPTWLVGLLAAPTNGHTKSGAPLRIISGERNNSLAAIAGAMRRQGASEAAIMAALQAVNADQCDPPLPDDEVRKIAGSIAGYQPYFIPTALPASANGNGHVTPPARPAINVGEKDLPRIRGDVWAAVWAANAPNPRLFRFLGGTVVRLAATTAGAPELQELTVDRMRHELGNFATWYLFRGKGVRTPELPPLHVVRDLLADPEPPLPPLLRVVETPVFGPAGTLQTEPGYDVASQTYYRPAVGFAVPPVPEEPSEEDVDRARSLIVDELMGDFCFDSDAERTNAVALFLLPYIRDMIDGPTPLHLIEAPTPGSGKTLLADVLLRPSLGRSIPVMTAPNDEDEWRKQLTSHVRAASNILLLDNISRTLDSGVLCSAITATDWSDRILGANEKISMPVRFIWVATANNPQVSLEIARRTLRIRLVPQQARPWQHDDTRYQHDPLREWVDQERPALVWAALTLVRAWIAAGRPLGTRTLGGYEPWSRLVGGILAHAGIEGFLGNLSDFYESSDTETDVWESFTALWWERYGGASVGLSELFPLAVETDGFPLGRSSTERAQKIAFGMLLHHARNRTFGQLMIDKAGKRHNSTLWRLITAQSVSIAGNYGSRGNYVTPFKKERKKEYRGVPKVPLVIPTSPPTVGGWVWCFDHEGQQLNQEPYRVVAIEHSDAPEGPRYATDGIQDGWDWPDGRDYAVLDAVTAAGGPMRWPLDRCEAIEGSGQ